MTVSRMTTRSEELARLLFAEQAAAHFAEHPEHWTYSVDELGPGVLLALRWGMGKDCVLVLRVDDDIPVNYQQLIREYAPRA